MREVTLFALPLSMGGLVNMMASFVAMLVVARLGKIELAAGALAIPSFITIMTVVATVFYAVGILISHCRGQENAPKEIGELVRSGFWLAILLALPASIVIWNLDKILLLCKQNPQLVILTREYFHFAALSITPTLITMVISQFYTGIGNPRFTMITSLCSLPVVIILCYGFILGHWGFPALGLAGVSCAIFIGQTIVCIGALLYTVCVNKNKHYAIFSGMFLPNWKLCQRLFLLGMPIGLQFGSELAAMTLATYFMGYFGIIALASSQIVSQYTLLIVMVTLGLSQAVTVLVSVAYGKAQLDLIKQYLRAAMLILMIFFMVVFLFFFWLPEILIRPYLNIHNPDNSNMIKLATGLFAVSGVTLLVDGLRNIFSGALRGLHDSKLPMKVGISCLWLISLPVCYGVAFLCHGGPIGLRFGFLSGFVIATLLLWITIRNKIKAMSSAAEVVYQPQYNF